jgi:hypothetical protein
MVLSPASLGPAVGPNRRYSSAASSCWGPIPGIRREASALQVVGAPEGHEPAGHLRVRLAGPVHPLLQLGVGGPVVLLLLLVLLLPALLQHPVVPPLQAVAGGLLLPARCLLQHRRRHPTPGS